ncbi:MAG: monofunctional biosynthetic peptidoglycan transglycosylase [Jannaschia helgolandensis]
MARKKTKKSAKTGLRPRIGELVRRGLRLLWRVALWGAVAVVIWVLAYRWIDPPTTPYILAEGLRLGKVERQWVDIDAIAPVMARSAVAAEDANFCLHWGFDVAAIRDAIEAGSGRGASTISQQVVKNVFLWQDRSWLRKALEAGMTPLMETLWPKRRIIEVYLNMAEFGEGVFGVQAAAQLYFGVDAGDLSAPQAAALASILPNPKDRNAAAMTSALQRKARRVQDGAATIRSDGRAVCFED